jgi:hypothetical protein
MVRDSRNCNFISTDKPMLDKISNPAFKNIKYLKVET